MDKSILLGEILGLGKPVNSDNIAPVNVNINTITPEMIERGVRAAQNYWLSRSNGRTRITHDLVVSILSAAMDIDRGRTEYSKSQTCGTSTGAPSGSDHD